MIPLLLIAAGVLAIFLGYCAVVLRYRRKQQRNKERALGLDPLR